MLRKCFYSPLMFDTVRLAFGLVQWEGRQVKPSHLFPEKSGLLMQCSQGLVLWVGLKAQWKMHCEVKFQRQKVTVDSFVVLWLLILEGWRSNGPPPKKLARRLFGDVHPRVSGGLQDLDLS